MSSNKSRIDHVDADRLAASMAARLTRGDFDGSRYMRNARIEIQKMFAAAPAKADVTEDVKALLAQLKNGKVPEVWGSLRDLCQALGHPLKLDEVDEEWSAIADPDGVRLVLEALATRGASNPVGIDRCMAGLFHTYLTYEPPTSGRGSRLGHGNWVAIREAIRVYATSSPTRRFGAAVALHASILTDDPTRGFAKRQVDGDPEYVEEAARELAIPEGSWFWKKLLVGRAREISDRDDSFFTESWPAVLEDSREHKGVLNQVLGLILDRYVTCERVVANTFLLDTATKVWKAPYEVNRGSWQVNDKTFAIVRGWANKKYIRLFFEELKSEHGTDRTRLDFWSKYAESIQQVTFFLRESTMHGDSPGLRELKSNMGQRIRDLHKTDVNAFAMQIGNFVFVEFSKTANAMYAYPEAFFTSEVLRSGTIEVAQLKRRHQLPTGQNNWPHHVPWDSKFSSSILNLTGVRQGQ